MSSLCSLVQPASGAREVTPELLMSSLCSAAQPASGAREVTQVQLM